MRLGIIREALHLPLIASQREALAAYGVDEIWDDRGSDFVADRRVQRVVSARKPGDEIVVYSIGVLVRPQGRPARAIRDILEAGLTLTVASPGEAARSFAPNSEALSLAYALAEHEKGRNVSPRTSVHQGGSRNRLSKYQIEYARKLHAEGESLRAIGLLFQLSPNHVLEVVAPVLGATNGSEAAAG